MVRLGRPGEERPAVLLDDEQALDVSEEVEELRRLLETEAGRLPRLRVFEHRLGPPIARPHKIIRPSGSWTVGWGPRRKWRPGSPSWQARRDGSSTGAPS